MILWLNPRAGISGDMTLGALIALGAPLDKIREAITQTGLKGWALDAASVQVDAIGATHVEIKVTDDATERHASELLEMVSRVGNPHVAEFATRAIEAIAIEEAIIHNCSPEHIHLHEIGGHDTIIDIVGVAAALQLLEIDQVISEPIAVGAGSVSTSHGLLPAPAPAAIALLAGATIVGSAVSGETVTPTGAALLKTAGTLYCPLPTSRLLRTGYGAGTKRFKGVPNVLQASVLEAVPPRGQIERLLMLETNVDDVSGEVVAHAVAKALEAGAADAWLTPIIGKKGRPAQVLTILAKPAVADLLEQILLQETGTLGVRRIEVDRHALPRTQSLVHVDGHEVRVKDGPFRSKPEFEDLARIASSSDRTFRDVEAEAVERINHHHDDAASELHHRGD